MGSASDIPVIEKGAYVLDEPGSHMKWYCLCAQDSGVTLRVTQYHQKEAYRS